MAAVAALPVFRLLGAKDLSGAEKSGSLMIPMRRSTPILGVVPGKPQGRTWCPRPVLPRCIDVSRCDALSTRGRTADIKIDVCAVSPFIEPAKKTNTKTP